MLPSTIRSFICGAFVLTLLLAGCGEGPERVGPTVKGKIVKGGQPLQVKPDENGYNYVEVILVPTFEGAFVESVHANPDGTFEFAGSGGGIKPGKYKVAVYQWEPNPDVDKLGGKFSEARTPIEKEISGDTADLGTIDLDKPNS